MGYLIERLQHGRAIAKREGARTNISQSLNSQTLEIARSKISLHEFCQTTYFLLAQIEQEARKLMFNQWPNVELHDLRDDLAKH